MVLDKFYQRKYGKDDALIKIINSIRSPNINSNFMKRDSIFYSLFQQYPNIFFDLLDNPPSNAANYRFDSVAVKEPKFEIDGVFLPPETSPLGIVYFCELQMQKDELLYERLIAESMVYFYRNRGRQGETCYNRDYWQDSFLSIYEFK
jgi:hypothetical protein